MDVLLADKQDITRAGLMFVLHQMGVNAPRYVEDKTSLMEQLKENGETAVVLDYTTFDIADSNELLVIVQRFPLSQWILFCEDLSIDFVRQVLASSSRISVLLKEDSMTEITEALHFAISGKRYISQHIAERLLVKDKDVREQVKLTPTETEVLRDIALGMTTKEIAEHRFSSFHTINTHRKNIFRKLGVNNAYEATKYALRAGLVDAAEYYI